MIRGSRAVQSVRLEMHNRAVRLAFLARWAAIRLAKSPVPRGTSLSPRSQLARLYPPTLPSFIILGTQKGGTSSLWSYLSQHPGVVPSYRKEVHFFDANYSKGLAWYLAHFPSSRSGAHITGEASPYYMFHPHAPRRIAERIPDAKLIVLLRNPIDRAYSHYHHNVRAGREALTFADALEREPQRLHGETTRLIEDQHYYSYTHQHYSYASRGIYIDQLENIRRYFPDEQILVLNSEELFNHPSTVYRRTLEFLGLAAFELAAYDIMNQNSYSSMKHENRRRLDDYVEPYNKRLYDYLNADFGWSR